VGTLVGTTVLGPGCVKTICVARESRILSNEQMSRHSDFATDGKNSRDLRSSEPTLSFHTAIGRKRTPVRLARPTLVKAGRVGSRDQLLAFRE